MLVRRLRRRAGLRPPLLSPPAAMLAGMAQDYVTGQKRDTDDAPKMGDSVGRRRTPSGWAHAVARLDANSGAGPWRAVCGATVRVLGGAWTPGRGLGSGRPCPECKVLAAA